MPRCFSALLVAGLLVASSAHAIPHPDRIPSYRLPTASLDEVKVESSAPPAAQSALALTPCVGGFAGGFPCDNVDLASQITLGAMGASSGADCWGWTDPLDGKEYALMGLNNGTGFVDITDPLNPVYLGKLPTHTSSSSWRDIKVYANHAFIVSEASGHGMQVFDLTQLRSVASPPATFSNTAHYSGFGAAHNIVINEATGYAYGVGASSCSGGLHFVDISTPTSPTGAGCFSADGYTHDAQVVIYNGPDATHVGREIAFAYNEDTLTIVDVTNKGAPVQLSRTGYSADGYTHQGWVTEDHRYVLMNDELDEQSFGHNTLTRIWDVSDLDNPSLIGTHAGTTSAIDHNLYVKGNFAYEANYRAGLQIMDLADVAAGNLTQVAWFDIYPSSNSASFNGAWNVYPYFDSGTVIVSGIEQGLFMLLPNLVVGTGSISGTVTLSGESDHSGVTVLAPGAGSAVTNVAGSYTITNVPVGSFDVTASKAGFVAQTQVGVAVADGQNVTGVDFALSPPSGSVSGYALLCDGGSPAGTQVSLNTGESTTTAADGFYQITGVFDGTYTVTASRAGYLNQENAGVVVSGGTGTNGVHFELPLSTSSNPATCPSLAIPDSNPTGVTSNLSVATSFVPDVISVDVEISHSWVGDLRIVLQHPDGTNVTLMDRPGVPASTNGCSDNDLNITFTDASSVDLETVCGAGSPWYVGDAAPSTPLSALLGKNAAGTWKLTVSDHVGSDTGTIDCWSLNLVSSVPCNSVVDAPNVSSVREGLRAPRPNPFGAETEVSFALARDEAVTVSVYDTSGRRVRTLRDGVLGAGEHSVSWSGHDDSGRRVSGGVYFVRLERVDGAPETRKITMLR